MKNILIYIIQLILLLVLFVATMCVGAVDISVKDVFASLFGVETDEMWRYIVVESRLPWHARRCSPGLLSQHRA